MYMSNRIVKYTKITMVTKEKLTAAESTLATMAKVVLVLGVIASIIVFFTSCIGWKMYSDGEIYGVKGINWTGLSILIYCLMTTLIAWSLLSVIVEISVNVRSKGDVNISNNWKKDFVVAKAADLNDKAKEILYRAVLESDLFKKVLSGGNETYHQQCIDELNKAFEPYLKEIGETQFKYTEANEILNVFK